ncbi:hypothetical protein BC829DRAFT_430882, partial [Chytridium lagenaria]
MFRLRFVQGFASTSVELDQLHCRYLTFGCWFERPSRRKQLFLFVAVKAQTTSMPAYTKVLAIKAFHNPCFYQHQQSTPTSPSSPLLLNMRITALLSLAFALQAASLPLYLQQDQVNLEARAVARTPTGQKHTSFRSLISPDTLQTCQKHRHHSRNPSNPQQPSKQNPPPQAHMPAPYRDYQTIMYERYVATNGRNMPVMTPAQASKDLSVSMSQIQAGIVKIRAAASTSASASGGLTFQIDGNVAVRAYADVTLNSGAIQNSANAILKVAETAKAADKVVAVAGNVGKAAKTASVNVKKAGK